MYKEARFDHRANKRKAAFDKREKDLELKRIELDKTSTAAAELAELVKKEATNTKRDLKKLQGDLLGDDSKMSALRQDIMAELEERVEHLTRINKEWAVVNKTKRAVEAERDASIMEK